MSLLSTSLMFPLHRSFWKIFESPLQVVFLVAILDQLKKDPLEEALVDKFIPRLFDVAVTLDDRQQFKLPVHNVGLGISS